MWLTLLDLWIHGSIWSLLAIGGTNSTIADIQRYTVSMRQWLTPAEFTAYFSLTQIAGPNGLIVTLIGLRVAGFPGAIVSTLASFVPSSCVTYWISDWIEKRPNLKWIPMLKQSLAPAAVGLFASSSVVLAREIDLSFGPIALTVASALLTWKSRIGPNYLIAAGAFLGLLDWI